MLRKVFQLVIKRVSTSEVSLGQSKKSQLLKFLSLLHTFFYLLETISCISFFSRPLIWTINSLIVVTGLDKILQNTEHDQKVKTLKISSC